MSKTTIANLALSHLGIGKEISILETEQSTEAKAIRPVFDTCARKVLRDFSWPFATRFVSLGLLDTPVPGAQWEFAYQYPSDCLNFRKILSDVRNDTPDTVVPYRIAYGDAGQIILTDKESAVAEYTVYVDDTSRYTPDFELALSYLIAAMIAPKVTAGDPAKLGQRALQLYSYEIENAKKNASNEEQREQAPEAEAIRVRG